MISGETVRAPSPAPPAGASIAPAPPAVSLAVSPSVSIDGTFRQLAACLPEPLQALLGGLPHRLGLTKSSSGQFGDFVTLHPNRELPLYAAEDPTASGGCSMVPERLERFQRAHHLGAFCWLVRDRLADGQVQGDESLLQIQELLRDRWVSALTSATDDSDVACRLVEEVSALWRRGVRGEREALRRGATAPVLYGRIVVEKLRWISAASAALLVAAGQPERARLFQRAYDLFLLSLQCIDDVNDEAEDHALHGCGVPAALGCSTGTLLRAAPKLAARAAAVAAEGRFDRFASWLTIFARALASWRRDGDPISDELGAIALTGELEGASA